MQILIQARWLVLAAALICGVLISLPSIYPPSVYWGLSLDWAFPAAGVLQAIGVFAMAKAGARKLWIIVGAISAVAWIIAYAAAGAAVQAGPGGLVYGILIVLPGMAIGLLTQIASLIGFATSKPRA